MLIYSSKEEVPFAKHIVAMLNMHRQSGEEDTATVNVEDKKWIQAKSHFSTLVIDVIQPPRLDFDVQKSDL